MLILTLFSMLILLCLGVGAMLWISLAKKMKLDKEKNSPFECGFQPLESPRIPLSIHFFLMGIMFLIFDIEIVLIMPLIIVMGLIKMKSTLLVSFCLLIILIWGLFNEWNYQSLDWTK
uniref:NADH-ubiquinone oxidoreductase chain 3 n=1 Tax=Xenophyes cascus TaxID=984453 RepID=A0A077UNL8_9HEMI|nr:NADH-ubiquinone oxidoreductase chain 3 [Xenophyes cascus]